MLVAIGTVDGENINLEHFGHSKIYVIYDYDGKEFKKVEERENPYAVDHMHAKVDEILQIVGDCKVWVGFSMGKSSMKKLNELGYKPILVNTDKVEEALEEIKQKI